MKKFFQTAVAGTILLTPFMAFATELGDIFREFGNLLGIITPVVVGLALLGFFWGLAMYVLNFGGDDKDKKKGRDMMVYGIIVLFVIVSVWGLVNVLQNTFGVNTVTNQTVPKVMQNPSGG